MAGFRIEPRKTPAFCLLLSPVVLVTAARATVQGQAAANPQEAFVRWTKETASHLPAETWHESSPADLAFLDEALEGKRIVYLGEGDHWIHEKYDYRLIFLEYLIEKGWRHIGMEMGYSDGKRIDRYIETGDATILERVALYGYRGDMREDRDDSPMGFAALGNPRCMEVFRAEERRFLEELRAVSASADPRLERLRWFGFDVDVFPGGGQADAVGILESARSSPLIEEILQRLRRREGETRQQEAGRLEGLIELMRSEESELRAALGKAHARELTITLQRLSDSLRFSDAAHDGPSSAKWMSGLIEREKTMCRFMDDFLRELPPEEKIILMGHNLHLSKNSEGISLGPVGGAAPGFWCSIGSHLAQKMPNQIYAIWMTYDHGRHGSILVPEGVEDVSSHAGSIEAYLAEAGSVFFLPLATKDQGAVLLRHELNFKQNGSLASGRLANHADAIFFVREITEPRLQ